MRARGRPTKRLNAVRCAAAWLAFVCASAALAQAAGPDAPVYWSRRDLSIPYRLAGTAAPGSEVVLYYSADQGRSWRVAGTAAPHVRAFRFQAPGDGEHWFTIRTYDASGVASPAGPLAPEMRVVVDTAGPRAERLHAELAGGALRVELAASDPAGFAAQPVYLYAQAAGHAGWIPVPITSSEPSPDGRSLRLTAQWRPPAGATRVEVRATLEDRAGNRVEQTAVAEAPAASTAIAASPHGAGSPYGFSSFGSPAGGTSTWGSASSLPAPNSMAPNSAAPNSTAQGSAARSEAASLDPFAAAELRAGPATSTNGFASTTRPSLPPSSPAFSGGAAHGSTALDGTVGGSVDPSSAYSRTAADRTAAAPASTPWPSESPRTRPLASQAPQAGEPGGGPFSRASFGREPLDPFFGRDSVSAPPDARRSDTPTRLVNNTEFEFDYELDRTGRWGVAKVELWGTDNDGRSWRRFAIDSDRQSPIHVTTPGEGRYGFRLVVESVGGLEAAKPRPGDAPEAIVGVDLTTPRVSLTDARQGVGYFADQLIIDWRADDEHLSERPIDLFYSNRASGPWIPISTNLPNNGRHTWRLQRHLPRRMYLRVEARDDAGNVATATSPEAVVIDMATASGSLRGVRPAGG